MATSESPPLVKARKAPRLTAKQEIQTIRNLPRVQRGIVIMKIAGVFLLAIGFEGLVTGQYWYSVLFVPLGVLVAMLPIRIRTGRRGRSTSTGRSPALRTRSREGTRPRSS